MAKSGRQLSLSAASTVGYKRCPKWVLTAATRCPPAEKPSTPILCGSMCHSAACNRTSPTVRCASSSGMDDQDPALHWPPGKVEAPRVRLGESSGRLLGCKTHDELRLMDPDAHVAI